MIDSKKIKKIRMDLKERFKSYETVKGAIFLASGLISLYTSLFHIQYIIQTAAVCFSTYFIIEGIRKILVNRIKQKIEADKLILERKRLEKEESNVVQS